MPKFKQLLNDSDVDSVTVSGINTVCRLTVKTDGEPTVEGITPGTITTKVSKSCRSGERAIFHIGIVKDNNTGRKISAVQRDTTFRADFTADALATSASYISVYALKVKETADYVVMKMCSDQSKELKWRKKNIGAEKETDNGYYFSWGNPEGYIYKNSKWVKSSDETTTLGTDGSFSEENYTGTSGASLTWNIPSTSDNDAACYYCGGGWRMPTSAEFQALYEACGGTTTPTALSSATPGQGIYWLSADQTFISAYSGVAGVLFCDGTNKLFFPAAGLGDRTFFSDSGSNGRYWSSTIYSDNKEYAYYLNFKGNEFNPQYAINGLRSYGYSVRPVSD